MSEQRRITERYRLETRVSSKDSGNVFHAVDTLSGETVAVKLINTSASEAHREAFQAWLATFREVLHPALPRILDFGFTPSGSAFLVTEYLPGLDLSQVADSPEQVLKLLLQVVDGLEALAVRGLAVRNLGVDNLRIVSGPRGEQVKILGLGSPALSGDPGTPDHPADLRSFALLTVRALGLPVEGEGDSASALLPLHVASALREPERLREMVEAALRGDPEGRLPAWKEVRRALRAALDGETAPRPAAPAEAAPSPTAGTVAVPRIPAWEEVRLGQGAPQLPWQDDQGGDSTMAIDRLGTPPQGSKDFTTRVIRSDELAPAAPAPPAPPAGPVRIPLKDLEPEPPAAAGTLQFPAPAPVPPPPPPASDLEETVSRSGVTLPFPATVPEPPPAPVPAPPQSPPAAVPPPPVPLPEAPSPVPPPAAVQAAKPGSGLRLALLVGIPLILLLVATVGLVAWMSRRSAEPDPQPQVQVAPPPQPAAKPTPAAPALQPVHAQILLAEESLNASDLAAAKAALDAIPQEQIALFTPEEQERYQRALAALTPLQSEPWAETLTRGLSQGDLRLLRTAAASPPAATTLTPAQKKDLARARKILDLDSRLSRAQRGKNQPDILRQATLLLAELPRNPRAAQARNQAADALLTEADARAQQTQFDAALAALEHLREEWRDHPGLAERLERVRAERRADEQMEEVLAAVTRAERAGRPLDGLQALERVRPNERFIERFRQARERLQAQFTELDRNPPQISLAGSSDLAYEKGDTVTVPLRITDDQGVQSTEAWARPEGGRFTRVTVRSLGGGEHAIDISPDLHQNKNIDFYVEAIDQSGHKGALGSVQRPQKIKRKKWFDKIRGDRDGS